MKQIDKLWYNGFGDKSADCQMDSKGEVMPEISRFYGIVVRMRYNDHPPPHFHMRYGNQDATVEIATGRVQGTMSRHALQLIWTGLDLHRDSLFEDWELSRKQEPLKNIPPLD